MDAAQLIPRHVAIIMDGNGRWARRRLMPRLEGHRQGAKAVRRALEFCRKTGIDILTLYAFSTENWQRPRTEVTGLMRLLDEYLDSEVEELHEKGVRLRTIGDLNRLPVGLASKMRDAMEKTRGNTDGVLNIALSYGGREEIVNAAVQIARRVRDGLLDVDSITEDVFAAFLQTADLPDPDLLIRTGGEVRISNFLLWQSAYTELYFTPALWPDFGDDTFNEALEAYRSRQRRFGRTSEQLRDEG
ncbi:MAG: isoprenyl transferase [Pseudomonadota bacterium]